jgi:hypothetical protein
MGNANPLAQFGLTPKAYLEEHSFNDVKCLFNQLSAAGNGLEAPWLYSIFNKLLRNFFLPQRPHKQASTNK